MAEGQPGAGRCRRASGLADAESTRSRPGEAELVATALAQAVVDGILTGGVYALMAAGLTLIFGVMDIINIAQGALIVLGAYLSYVLSVHLGIDLFVGLIITDARVLRARRGDRVGASCGGCASRTARRCRSSSPTRWRSSSRAS